MSPPAGASRRSPRGARFVVHTFASLLRVCPEVVWTALTDADRPALSFTAWRRARRGPAGAHRHPPWQRHVLHIRAVAYVRGTAGHDGGRRRHRAPAAHRPTAGPGTPASDGAGRLRARAVPRCDPRPRATCLTNRLQQVGDRGHGTGHIVLGSPKLAQSVAFHTDVLGFRVMHATPAGPLHARRWGAAIAMAALQRVSHLNHEAARRAGQTVVGFIKDDSMVPAGTSRSWRARFSR